MLITDPNMSNILVKLATMNQADSMQSQDNINKVVSQEREK